MSLALRGSCSLQSRRPLGRRGFTLGGRRALSTPKWVRGCRDLPAARFGKLRASSLSRVRAVHSTGTGSTTLSCASTGGDFDIPFEKAAETFLKYKVIGSFTHQQQGSALSQGQSITWATRPLRSTRAFCTCRLKLNRTDTRRTAKLTRTLVREEFRAR